MISRISESLLLRPADLKPAHADFEVIGVFNPGAVKFNNKVVLLVRVAERPREHRQGFVGLPRWKPNGEVVVDWTAKNDLCLCDPRIVRSKANQWLRLTSISHLRVFAWAETDSTGLVSGPVLLPASPMEEFGIEDPRIVEIDGTYWITYVAVSRHGAATALASTIDFMKFKRHGIIFYPENKDVVLFPGKVNDKYFTLHRPNPNSQFGPPEIWVASSHNLLNWGQHECLFAGSAKWENGRVGAGTPPVLLEQGWLEIYHGCCQAKRIGEVGAYSAGALLLDRDNPAHILRRSLKPIMQPAANFELTGFVDNVVFPTAIIKQGDTLSLYYGAADTYTGVVEFSQRELLAALH